ncbi:LOW QUALITY PROTEIN: kinesin-like protein Klp61F [Trichoplusia ni]|uniref:LOW QUALITY PROTEIN: kinesin-like protein Klp61F n=1 Tax=Trichoplusia ni TaxID=7111 RepID=A0A7E5WE16_TRINI|nr:LOW QUALITY PROTEIN: kinesin-like protein Klp61F [Trichoplusia ni]
MTTDKIRKDKNQNIQVFIRLRPLNQREKDIKSLGVIEVVNNREVVVRQSQQTSHTKKFTFDRAFAPSASQLTVYQEVVSPLIEEVLNGYNCTVFAYGQTGTGKTHTMVGEHTGTDTHWQNDPLAGIIPRALSQLFDELRLTNTEYTVRVSYLELYNEELFDLLATSEDNSKLRIYEDVTRKGSNIVNGLEEITVYNKNEVYKIMAQGQERKRVASTLMNAQSSRSHTVFTIVVHMKENSPEGEELMKIGKLNLVDLAGSENISKAGSDNPAKKERARECVNINQSLLTLGRVITALVERHPHIPYRESKLTRILQESLGGRTKTSIIATISPGHKDLEETMSTLEYAHRAKNIQNKPEVNQKMTKKAILKEYAEEIDRLKRDLQATRDRNGVYLASETYAEMTLKEEEQRKEIQELLLKKRAMEEERDRMEAVFEEMNQKLEVREQELANTVGQLNTTKAELATTSKKLVKTKQVCEEQQQLVSAHCSTEKALSAQARQLLATADVATKHVACLHDTVDKRKSVESWNLETTRTYRSQSCAQRGAARALLSRRAAALHAALLRLQQDLETYTTSSTQTQEQNKQQLDNLVQSFLHTINEIKSATSESHASLVQSAAGHRNALHAAVSEHSGGLQASLLAFLQGLGASLQTAQAVDVKGKVAAFVEQWVSGAAARVWSLSRAQAAWARAGAAAGTTRSARARRADARRARLAARRNVMLARAQEMEEESTRLESLLTQQLADIDTERQDTENRLQQWMEEKRRLLEEELAKHVASEKKALEERLAKKVAEIEVQKKILEQRMERYKEWQQIQFEADKEELEMADADLQEIENSTEESINDIKKYSKEFEEGTNAISVDMEIFSKNIVEVVDHINSEMLAALQNTREHVEKEVKTVIEADQQTSQTFVQGADAMLADIVASTKNITDALIDKIEANNATAVEALTSVSASTSSLISCSLAHQAAHDSKRCAAREELDALQLDLDEALQNLERLEGRYLSQEYKVYEPTGSTPSRLEFRYPRQLAATSPHARILARLRMQPDNDDDCVVVESEAAPRAASDSDSSEDSAVFAAPSPPVLNQSKNKIVKSTSETDILFTMKRQQEQSKENTERSISNKKPSKLPAPSSHKKPLVERNGN